MTKINMLREETPLAMFLKPLPLRGLTENLAVIKANDAHLSDMDGLSAHIIPEGKQLIVIAEASLTAIELACKLAKSKKNQKQKIIPQLIIIDNSRRASELWEKWKDFFSEENKIFGLHRKVKTFVEKNCALFISPDFNKLQADVAKNKTIEYIEKIIKKYGYKFVRQIVLQTVYFRQAWQDNTFFRDLKKAYFENSSKKHIVVYVGNWVSLSCQDVAERILNNIYYGISPDLVIHSNLNISTMMPDQVFFYKGREKENMPEIAFKTISEAISFDHYNPEELKFFKLLGALARIELTQDYKTPPNINSSPFLLECILKMVGIPIHFPRDHFFRHANYFSNVIFYIPISRKIAEELISALNLTFPGIQACFPYLSQAKKSRSNFIMISMDTNYITNNIVPLIPELLTNHPALNYYFKNFKVGGRRYDSDINGIFEKYGLSIHTPAFKEILYSVSKKNLISQDIVDGLVATNGMFLADALQICYAIAALNSALSNKKFLKAVTETIESCPLAELENYQRMATAHFYFNDNLADTNQEQEEKYAVSPTNMDSSVELLNDIDEGNQEISNIVEPSKSWVKTAAPLYVISEEEVTAEDEHESTITAEHKEVEIENTDISTSSSALVLNEIETPAVLKTQPLEVITDEIAFIETKDSPGINLNRLKLPEGEKAVLIAKASLTAVALACELSAGQLILIDNSRHSSRLWQALKIFFSKEYTTSELSQEIESLVQKNSVLFTHPTLDSIEAESFERQTMQYIEWVINKYGYKSIQKMISQAEYFAQEWKDKKTFADIKAHIEGHGYEYIFVYAGTLVTLSRENDAMQILENINSLNEPRFRLTAMHSNIHIPSMSSTLVSFYRGQENSPDSLIRKILAGIAYASIFSTDVGNLYWQVIAGLNKIFKENNYRCDILYSPFLLECIFKMAKIHVDFSWYLLQQANYFSEMIFHVPTSREIAEKCIKALEQKFPELEAGFPNLNQADKVRKNYTMIAMNAEYLIQHVIPLIPEFLKDHPALLYYLDNFKTGSKKSYNNIKEIFEKYGLSTHSSAFEETLCSVVKNNLAKQNIVTDIVATRIFKPDENNITKTHIYFTALASSAQHIVDYFNSIENNSATIEQGTVISGDVLPFKITVLNSALLNKNFLDATTETIESYPLETLQRYQQESKPTLSSHAIINTLLIKDKSNAPINELQHDSSEPVPNNISINNSALGFYHHSNVSSIDEEVFSSLSLSLRL